MSLPRLQVEPGNPFAAGQCYVALSRAMEIDGLCINQYDRDETKIDYEAKRFHEAVTRAAWSSLRSALTSGGAML